MADLEVRNLSCDYGEGEIFNNISFSVNRGEAIAIIGPSGSGKTTLAYCLVGIIPNKIRAKVRGQITLDGKNLMEEDFREIVRRINIVMQNFEVQIFGLTVEEDVLFGLENLGLDEDLIEEKLNWALKTFGLEKYRQYYVSSLSGGLRQRLAIASTIVLMPEFLVLDDPTSNLDWRGVNDLREAINILKSEGKGVIILARRIKGLEKCIDRIYKLNNGKLESYFKLENSIIPERRRVNKKETAITLENVWFKYTDEYVLRNVSLEIRKGEVVAIMGPNGSGKTTLVKHINSLLKPTRGRVTVLGMDTRKYSAAQMSKYVGFVFQDPDRHLVCETVWDEVLFGCRNLGLSENMAKRALETLGLYDKKDKPPYNLSMGEKIRLSIASALAMNPKVLILDEPTTGQDERTLGVIRKAIDQFRYEGRTVIVVTHDSDFALEASDRVVVLREGQVVANDRPDKILLDERKIEKLELEPPEVLFMEMKIK